VSRLAWAAALLLMASEASSADVRIKSSGGGEVFSYLSLSRTFGSRENGSLSTARAYPPAQ
jgi:hypothetical protein